MKQFCKHGHDVSICGRDKDGHCKNCRKILRQKMYSKNKDREIAYAKKYGKEHYIRLNKAARQLMAKNPDRRRKYALKHINKVNPTLYDELFLEQKGRCAICDTEYPNGGKGQKYFCLDHDHKTGKIRGLLCHPCNRGLGQFKDNTCLLIAAWKYLINAQ